MANELIKKNFKDIADAIRSKTGENGLITAEEMPSKIESIETGLSLDDGVYNIDNNEATSLKSKICAVGSDGSLVTSGNFTSLSTPCVYWAKEDEITPFSLVYNQLNYVYCDNHNPLSFSTGQVSIGHYYQAVSPKDGFLDEVSLGELSITDNGRYNVVKYGAVDVNVPQGVFPSGTYTINDNGFYDISGYQNVNVVVPSTEGIDDSLIINPELVDKFDFNLGATYLSKIIVEGNGGLFVVRDSNSFWINNMKYGNSTSYFNIGSSGDIAFYPDGDGSGTILTDGIKVRMPVAIDAEYYYYDGVEIELNTGGQEGFLLDGSQQFDLDSHGDIVIEFYDLTGKHKLAQYSINEMWKGSSC